MDEGKADTETMRNLRQCQLCRYVRGVSDGRYNIFCQTVSICDLINI